jgi:hypothetical protein
MGDSPVTLLGTIPTTKHHSSLLYNTVEAEGSHTGHVTAAIPASTIGAGALALRHCGINT